MTTLEERYPPKFKVGDKVKLVNQYRDNANREGKPYKGVIKEHFTDLAQLDIGASYNGYVIEGVGTYGEAAMELDWF